MLYFKFPILTTNMNLIAFDFNELFRMNDLFFSLKVKCKFEAKYYMPEGVKICILGENEKFPEIKLCLFLKKNEGKGEC